MHVFREPYGKYDFFYDVSALLVDVVNIIFPKGF